MCCLCFNSAFSTSKTTEQNKPLDKIFVWPLCFYISIPAYLSFLEGAMCNFYFLTSLVMPLSDCNTLWTSPSPSVLSSTNIAVSTNVFSNGNSIHTSRPSTKDWFLSSLPQPFLLNTIWIAPYQWFHSIFSFYEICFIYILVWPLRSCLSYPMVRALKAVEHCHSQKHRLNGYIHFTEHLLSYKLRHLVNCLTFFATFIFLRE